MAEIASAYVQLIPSFRGLPSALQKELGAVVPAAAQSGKQGGGSYSKGFAGAFSGLAKTGGQAFKTVGKVGLTAIGAIGTTIAGIAIKGGFSRALDLQTAQARMKGLGWSTAQISQVMKNTTSAVKGTAYGLGEAASVAAMFGTAGIKGGSDMEGALKAVANVAAASGRSMTDVGLIFSSVKARGKLLGDDMRQLTSSGVPVLSLLAKKLGTTEAAVQKMVSSGKIDFKTFSDTMREGLGDTALATGNTFTGALVNVIAALGRLGEKFATPILDKLTPLLKALQPLIDVVTEKIEGFSQNIGNKIGNGIGKATSLIQGFAPTIQNMKLPKIDFGKIFGPLIPAVGGAIGAMGGILQHIPLIGRAFTGLTGPVGLFIGGLLSMYKQSMPFRQGVQDLIKLIWQIAQDVMPLFGAAVIITGAAFKPLGDILGTVLSFLSKISGVIELAAVAFAAYKGAVTAITTATKIWGAITKIQTGLQIALNLVMSLNPVGLIIAAIVALVAGIYLLWNHCEPFRTFMQQMWEAIKQKAQVVVDWFLGTVVPWFAQTWESIKSGFQAFTSWFSASWQAVKTFFSSIWEGMKNVILTVWNWIVNAINAYITRVHQTISAILGFIKSIWTTGWATVKNVVSNTWGTIKNAVSNGVNGVVGFVKSLPTKIKNIFSSAGRLLLDAGKKIIKGLIDGIKNMFGNVKATLSELTNKLTSWKGPPKKDATLLFGAGQLIIQGFKQGLESEYGGVEKSLTKFTNRLADPNIQYDYAQLGTPGYGGTKTASRNPNNAAPAEVNQYFPNVQDPHAAALAAAQGLLGVPFVNTNRGVMV